MSQWKFQIIPSEQCLIGSGFRMDDIGESVENEVNDALRYPFKFHGVNKIVVWLGPNPNQSEEYTEVGGVGEKVMRDFDISAYIEASDERKIGLLREASRQALDWIYQKFDDTNFIDKARSNLDWLNEPST